MAHEPIIAPAELPPLVIAHAPGAEMPQPSAAEERAADDVFTQGAAALLALNAGAGIVGLLIDNNTSKPLPDEKKQAAPKRAEDE